MYLSGNKINKRYNYIHQPLNNLITLTLVIIQKKDFMKLYPDYTDYTFTYRYG